MKFKSSKKLVSLFLAIMMVVTSVPAFAMTAFAGTDNCKYLFAYFTGNTKYGQNVRFALSDDGYTFTALNNNEPVLSQTKSDTIDTSSGCARDPYITRDPNGNGFYMVATDMDATGGWEGDTCVYVWHSNNLVDWTQIADFDMRSFGGSFESITRAWAPQIIWDSTSNRWMMYLSLTMTVGSTKEWNVMYYTYTTDFQTFTTPQKFEFSTGVYTGRIDADIVVNNGTYYMYYKDEGANKIMMATSNSLTGTYTVGKTVSDNLSSKNVEGNAMYQLGNSDTWVMMLDEYSNGTFAYGTTTDFVNFTKYTGSTSANSALTARHGSVMQITTEEYNRLKTATFNSAAEPTGEGVDLTENLVGQYLTTSDVTADASGKGNTLTKTGTVSWDVTGYSSDFGAASFTNGNYLSTSNFKSIIGDTATGFTISFLGYKDSSNDDKGRFVEVANYAPKSYAWRDGDTDCVLLSNWANNNYEYMKDTSEWNTGRFGGSAGEQAANSWHLYTIVYDSTAKNLRMFVDGNKSVDDTNDKLDSNFLSALSNLNIACTCYPDNTLTGKLRDMRVYNRAITDDEASRLPKQYQLDGYNEKKQLVENIINNATIKTANNSVKYYGTDVGISSGVLYTSNSYSDSNSSTWNMNGNNNTNMQAKVMAGSNRMIFLYTNDRSVVKVPAIAEFEMKGSTVKRYHMNYLTTDSSEWTVKDNWIRTTAWNNWATSSGSEDGIHYISIDANHDTTNFSSNKGGITEKSNFKNIISYNGNFNFSNYVASLSNPTFKTSTDVYCTWAFGGKSAYSNAGTTGIGFGLINSPVYKVIDYQPFINIFNKAKSEYQAIHDNEWMYDVTSLGNYYKALAKIFSYDVTAYDYSTDTGLNNSVSAMSDAISSYALPTLKQINVNFVMADDSTVKKTVTAGNNINGLIPANTAESPNNDGTHNVYSWPTDCTSSYMPKENVTFHEESVVRDCTFDEGTTVDGVTTKKCTICGYIKTEINLDKDGYNAAVQSANAEIANTAKNTAESIANLQAVLNANSNPDSAQNQKQLDAMTKAILDAIAKLQLNSYEVKLYYVIDGTQSEVKETVTGKYGEYFTFNAPAGNYSVEKWIRTIGTEKDEKVGATNTSLTGRIVNNANYYVYAKSVKPAQTGSAVVSLRDRLGRVVDNMYVPLTDGQATLNVTVNSANRSITVNGTIMTAPNVTFYTFKGFEINGEPVTDGRTYTITGDTAINAVYDFGTTFTITTVNCKADHPSAYWDQKVTVTADNATDSTQWYVNDELVGYGKTYTFRANANVTVTCRNDTAVTVTPSAVVTRLSYNNPVEKTITAVAQLNVPEGYTVKEAGVLLKTSSVNNNDAVNNIENYTGSKANARKFKANNFVKDTNQYVISVYASKTYDSLYVGAVAYVTYTDANGNESTAYSSKVATCDYNKA